jgi:hypothetical protein
MMVPPSRSSLARILGAIGTRRLIFLLLAVLVTAALLLPASEEGLTITDTTEGLYQAIEDLKPGDPILISFDYDPPSKPELYPASRAVLRHAFRKRLRVVALGLWPAGKGLAQEAIDLEANFARDRQPDVSRDDAYPLYGQDYVYLGFLPGEDAVIVRLTEGVQGTSATDYRGEAVDGMEVWTGRDGREIKTLADFTLVVTISAGFPGIDEWIRKGRGKERFALAAAVTAVTAPGKMPFYTSGQIVGLLNGMRGAAEYESLVNDLEDESRYGIPPLHEALSGMNALSSAHFLVIALVVVSNVLYFRSRRRGRP